MRPWEIDESLREVLLTLSWTFAIWHRVISPSMEPCDRRRRLIKGRGVINNEYPSCLLIIECPCLCYGHPGGLMALFHMQRQRRKWCPRDWWRHPGNRDVNKSECIVHQFNGLHDTLLSSHPSRISSIWNVDMHANDINCLRFDDRQRFYFLFSYNGE